LINCRAGCSFEAVLAALGLQKSDLFVPSDRTARSRSSKASKPKPSTNDNGQGYKTAAEAVAFKGKASASWGYVDEFGTEIYHPFRFECGDGEKDFLPAWRDPSGLWHCGKCPFEKLPLYHRDELPAADLVFICEGEKCADLVRDLGLVATTSAHGCGSAHKSDWSILAGKRVGILPDNDKAGTKYAKDVCGLLDSLVPRPCIRPVDLGLSGKGDDIEEWLDGRPDSWGPDECGAELRRLFEAAPDWMPDRNGTADQVSAFQELKSSADSDDAVEEDDARDPIGSVDIAAFHGVLGEIALATNDETEANPLFVLLHLLVFYGILIGKKAHFVIGPHRHYMNLFIGLVGESGVSRKGTSADAASEVLRRVEPYFVDNHITGGLNSGAGLLYHLRDPSLKSNGRGQPTRDDGVEDKRRVFLEEEFAATLMQGQRETDPILCYVRQLWDCRRLIQSLTKDPTKVTDAYAGIVGHVTPADLKVHLTNVDKANGTANRFLWIYGMRNKLLPSGGNMFSLLDMMANALSRLRDAIDFGKEVDRLYRSPEVEKRWDALYRQFANRPAGLIGAFYARAPVQIMRMASIFTLADRRRIIEGEHLDAAEAIWAQSDRSLRYLFRSDVDADADKLLAALHKSPEPLTCSEISKRVFKGNWTAAEINKLLEDLLVTQQIERIEPATGGRGRPAVTYTEKRW
jgi:hypothetical protein